MTEYFIALNILISINCFKKHLLVIIKLIDQYFYYRSQFHSMNSIQPLHYRNGTYQGQVRSNKKNGKGILITDQGQIVVGAWKNDKLYGNGLTFLNPFEYSYGQFNRGQLEGWSKFQSADKILVTQFNSNHPINKQLLIDKNDSSYKITIPARNSIFQQVKQVQLPESSIQQLIFAQMNAKLPLPVNYSLSEYLIENYKNDDFFQTETLLNGYLIFKVKDQTSVVSLGLVVNKNNQLVSYGCYVNNKLHGYGCKFQNSIRYEGMFENGFLNGQGLKFNAGKYSFGLFQNGTLTNPIYFEERSLASEQKLKELKKLNHISHLSFSNIYLPQNFLKFKGVRQIIFEISLRQEYIFSQSAQKKSPQKQGNLIAKLLSKQETESKSNFSVSNRKINKNPQEQESRVSEIGKSTSGINSLRKYKM